MKRKNILFWPLIMLSLLIFVQCEENEDAGVDKQIDTVLPSNFKVDIPKHLVTLHN